MTQDKIEPSHEARQARLEAALDRQKTEREIEEAGEVFRVLHTVLEANHLAQKARAALFGVGR